MKQKLVVIGIMLAMLFSVALSQQQPIQASSDREVESNDDAISAGWKEGKNDYLNGDAREYECSSANSDTYCSLYRMGYEQGWQAQMNLGRAHGSDPQ